MILAGALVAGLLFGGGLMLSGMTNPATVLAFLDVAGDWNPALAFTMAGAVLVAAPAFLLVRRRSRSVLGAEIRLPDRHRIDTPLVSGSALFGIGWGLAGICPGPALVLLGTGAAKGLVFVLAMLAGMAIFTASERLSRARQAQSDPGK